MQVAKHVFDASNIQVFHAYEQNIHPCDDCKLCHHKLACKHKDDMDAIKKAIQHADTLILVSPIYFGALSDQCMRIINRFQMMFEAKFTHQKPFTTLKNIYLISTAASTDTSMFQGAKLTLSILKSLFSAEHTNALTLGGTDDCKDILATYQDEIASFKRSI